MGRINPNLLKQLTLAGLLLICLYAPQCWVFFKQPDWEIMRVFPLLPGVLGMVVATEWGMPTHDWMEITAAGVTTAGAFATGWLIARLGRWWILVACAILLSVSIASAMMAQLG